MHMSEFADFFKTMCSSALALPFPFPTRLSCKNSISIFLSNGQIKCESDLKPHSMSQDLIQLFQVNLKVKFP